MNQQEDDYYLKYNLRDIEISLLKVIIVGSPDSPYMRNYAPGYYKVRNTKTNRVTTYYACSADRALALAYMDQGWEHPMRIVSSCK